MSAKFENVLSGLGFAQIQAHSGLGFPNEKKPPFGRNATIKNSWRSEALQNLNSASEISRDSTRSAPSDGMSASSTVLSETDLTIATKLPRNARNANVETSDSSDIQLVNSGRASDQDNSFHAMLMFLLWVEDMGLDEAIQVAHGCELPLPNVVSEFISEVFRTGEKFGNRPGRNCTKAKQ